MESSKEIILGYLRDNYGREVPVSEISEKFDLKASTISNAIRELGILGEIEIERRQLIHGKYTVIWIKGDVISHPFVHEKEKLDIRLLEYFEQNINQKKTFKTILDYFSPNIEEERIDENSIEKNLLVLVNKSKLKRSGSDPSSLEDEEEFWLQKKDFKHSIQNGFGEIDLPYEDLIDKLRLPDYDQSQFIDMIDRIYPYLNNDYLFITNLITPLMYEVGTRWEQTLISTAEEHIISTRIEKLIVARINRQKNTGSRGTILLAPVEGEFHVISLLSLELLFSGLNYKIINMGQPLPFRSLIQYINSLEDLPEWIFLTITLNTFQGTLVHNLETLQAAFKNRIMIAVGGQGLEKMEMKLPPNISVIQSKKEMRGFLEALS